MKLKPVEPPCKAIIIKDIYPENLGIEVFVVGKTVSDIGGVTKEYWEAYVENPISCTQHYLDETTNKRGTSKVLSEPGEILYHNLDGLMRIDDHDPDEQDKEVYSPSHRTRVYKQEKDNA